MDSNFDIKSLGIIHLPVIIFTAVIAIGAILFAPQVASNLIASPTPTPKIARATQATPASPTPSATPTVTTTPKPSTSVTPKPSTTPKATVAPVSGPPGSGFSSYTIATEKGNFSISVVAFDISGVRMVVDSASESNCSNDCPVIPLSEYVSRNGAFAGINGTYFCPPDYADCAGKKNSFDFPIFNNRIGRWINEENLFWNDRSILFQNGGSLAFNRNANASGKAGGTIVSSPGLVDGGNVIADQFPLTATQQSKGTRGGIGYKGNMVYLVIARGASVVDFGYIFKALGATHAINLDGGGSTALWFGGYKVGPGRSLPNAVVFVR